MNAAQDASREGTQPTQFRPCLPFPAITEISTHTLLEALAIRVPALFLMPVRRYRVLCCGLSAPVVLKSSLRSA